jgi:hypothetical protein
MAEIEKDTRYRAYWEAIQRRVCHVCLDQRDDGSCGMSGRLCAIEGHLPGVVEAICAVESDSMDDYVTAIRAHVCGRCEEQDAQERCGARDKGLCALDAYLFLVVDAIQEVKGVE